MLRMTQPQEAGSLGGALPGAFPGGRRVSPTGNDLCVCSVRLRCAGEAGLTLHLTTSSGSLTGPNPRAPSFTHTRTQCHGVTK